MIILLFFREERNIGKDFTVFLSPNIQKKKKNMTFTFMLQKPHTKTVNNRKVETPA